MEIPLRYLGGYIVENEGRVRSSRHRVREQRSCKTAPALRACLSRRLWRWPWRARSSNCGTAAATITLSLFLARNLLSANSSGAAYAALLRFVAILTSSALDLASRCVPFRGEASSEGTMRAVLELCVRSGRPDIFRHRIDALDLSSLRFTSCAGFRDRSLRCESLEGSVCYFSQCFVVVTLSPYCQPHFAFY